MDTCTRLLIESIHRASGKCVLAVTGGGAAAAAMLLGVPGASRTVLEVIVPYDDDALEHFLGRRPEQFCSAATARAMAEHAYARARLLAPGEMVVGIGCTASLATDRPKRGDHRVHVSARSSVCADHSLTLCKGARDRAGEEKVVARIILNALAEALGVDGRLTLPLATGEVLEVEIPGAPGMLDRFFAGAGATVCVSVDGRVGDGPMPAILVSGSFNPLHEAHLMLARVAGEFLQAAPSFELSNSNVDKAALSPEEVRRRLRQFSWQAPLWLTRAPTFAAKALLFPGVTFAVGADTAMRIVLPRYYGNSEAAMTEALTNIRAQGCRFLVVGRADATGRFLVLEDLAIPAALRDLFVAVPESLFRMDISSTGLRSKRSDEI